jgi:hypothetical protein
VDETSADVLGCLNIGPTFGVALIGYFKKMQAWLETMHKQNPTWSTNPSNEAIALFERNGRGSGNQIARRAVNHDNELATR